MKYLILILALALGGCAYTLPSGEKVPREVYRTEANRELMTLAVAADREYDSRNPIQPPPAVCQNPDQQTMTGMDLAFCAMATATYNAQLQVREQQRKAQAQYAAAVIDRQADERMAKWQLALNNPITAAVTNRLINGRPQSSNAGPRISVRGHTIRGNGAGGAAGAGGSGTASEEVAAAGGPGGGGGGAIGHSAGDQNVTIVVGDNNQSGSGAGTYSPVLEYATGMGSTRPVWSEGASDNRTQDDNDSLLNGGIF